MSNEELWEMNLKLENLYDREVSGFDRARTYLRARYYRMKNIERLLINLNEK